MGFWNGGLRFVSDHTISHANEAALLQTVAAFTPAPLSAGIFDQYRQVFEVWFQVESETEMGASAAVTGLLPGLSRQLANKNLDYQGYQLQQLVPPRTTDGVAASISDYVLVFRGGTRISCMASRFEARDGYYQFLDHENRPVALFLRENVVAIMSAAAGSFPTSFGAAPARMTLSGTSPGEDEI